MNLKKIGLRLVIIILFVICINKEQTFYSLWISSRTAPSEGEFLTYQQYLYFADTSSQERLPKYKLSEQGHWLWWQRVCFMEGGFLSSIQQNTFEQAALVNTNQAAANHYKTLPERQAYYRWANTYFNKKRIKVKWMDAADKTVGNLLMALMPPAKWLGYTSEEIQQFIVVGNKLILDDMMPKIKDLNYHKDFSMENAFKWDAQLLSDEQTLIQQLYENLSNKNIVLLEKNIQLFYGVSINLLDVKERWSFGMHLMGYTGIVPNMMPVAGGDWEQVSIK